MNSPLTKDEENKRLTREVYDIPSIHMIIDHELRIETVNKKGVFEFDYQREEELQGQSFMELVAVPDRSLVQDYLEVMDDQHQKERELTCRLLSREGKVNWYQIYFRRLSNGDNVYYELFCLNTTKQKVYEQYLDGEKQVLEAIAKNWPLQEILTLVARIVESISEGVCSILLLDNDGETIILGGAPSLPAKFNKKIDGLKIGPKVGSCGTAMFHKKVIVVSDIETDPLWEDIKDKALEFGLKACWSNPIINHQGSVLGAFAIYYKESKSPSARDLKVIEFFTHLAELAITHSQVRELEIHMSEEKYRMIAENTSDLIVLFNRNGKVIYVSPSIQEMFGLDPKTIVNKSLYDPEFPLYQKDKVRIKRALSSKRKMNFIVESPTVNGKSVILELNSAPIFNAEGEIESSVIVARDITERQQAKEEIERLHHQNHSILHAAGDGIYGVDLNGRVMFCNHTAATILGYEIEELIGKNMHQTIHSKDQKGQSISIHTCCVHRSILEKRTLHNENDIFWRKDGGFFPVEYMASPIIERGEVTGTVVTFRDVTERKREEEEREKQELAFRKQQQTLQQLSVLVNELPLEQAIKVITENSALVLNIERVSVWVYSKESQAYICKDHFNKKVEVHSARGSIIAEEVPEFIQSLEGDRVFIFKQGDARIKEVQPRFFDRFAIESAMVAPLYSGKLLNGFVTFSVKDNSTSWNYDEQNFATAIADLLNLLLEKEERLKTEDLLRKTEKLSIVGQLAAGVAHEIRNPLTSLKGFLQLLSERDSDAENGAFYEIMLSEIERINFISGELLFLAKPQAKLFTRVDLNAMCSQVLNLFGTEASLHNVQFEFSNQLENKSAIFLGDPNQIKQVLVNIIKNGIEAMEDGGRIQVSLEEGVDQYLQLVIQDHGKGITQERLEKLGEPFYTTKEKGTGLGLMVSYRIIEAHKGTIQVASELNKGTTVTIRLPKAPSPERVER